MNTFPTFIGTEWDIKKRIITKTASEEAASGASYRTSRWPVGLPHFEFDLTWAWLSQADRDSLEAFFIAQNGPGTAFLLSVINDSSKTAAACGTGNGANKVFQIPLPAQTNIVTSTIKDNGATAGANTVSATGLITFTTAPLAGHVITADCTYAYVVQFKDDELEINQMFNQGYEQEGITFRTVR